MLASQANPSVIYHADWGSKDAKRWCANATLGADGHYTASAPRRVGDPSMLIEQFRTESQQTACVFIGFDFPIGVPAYYAERASISSFRAFLPRLGQDEWSEFYSVCNAPEQISVYRPFYPDGAYKARRKRELLNAHSVLSVEPLLRSCERGGDGQKQACCLFWTLGGNQVGKAAIVGWRDVLAPALRKNDPVFIWPFDGSLELLFKPGNIVIAETYPAECYGWFFNERLKSKRTLEARRKVANSLKDWAASRNVQLVQKLRLEIDEGFHEGEDAFDAVIGLFGMLEVCLGHRTSGESKDENVKTVEGWILGRQALQR